MAKYTKEEKTQAWNSIEAYRGKTIKAIVTHVSRSGMARWMEFYSVGEGLDGKESIDRITWQIARIIDAPMNDNGLRMDGCGMDMCFSAISNFNYAACAHDHPEMTWEERREKFGRIYDDYFFNANRM